MTDQQLINIININNKLFFNLLNQQLNSYYYYYTNKEYASFNIPIFDNIANISVSINNVISYWSLQYSNDRANLLGLNFRLF